MHEIMKKIFSTWFQHIITDGAFVNFYEIFRLMTVMFSECKYVGTYLDMYNRRRIEYIL